MGIIWILLMVISIGMMMFADPAGILSAMTASVNESLLLCVKMCGVYCVWLGFIKIMEEINALKAVGNLLRPLIEKLFGSVSPKAKDYLVVNISANLIGVANAATPTAIKAIDEMDKGDVKMTRGMAMLFVINSTGIELLKLARKETGLPIVTEIMSVNHLPLFEDVDLIQVGARNMQNFELLKELGKLDKPILLKRGLANTLKELLMSAEYIMAGGNERVILCERGIRTFDDYTRNTLDLAAVPMLKELTHLPIIVDPSHATGIARLVPPMALAAAACGADGLIIEVHNDPMKALCDGAQSLRPEQYDELAKKVRRVREVVNE